MCVFSASVFGKLNFAMTNTKIIYENPYGLINGDMLDIKTDQFTYHTKQFPVTVNVKKSYMDSFSLVNDDYDLSFKISKDSFFHGIDYARGSFEALVLDNEKLDIQIPYLFLKIQDGLQVFKGVKVRCDRAQNTENSLLKDCLNNASLSFQKVQIAKANQKTVSKALGLKKLKIGRKKVTAKYLKNFNFNVSDSNYNLKFYFKYFIKFKFKSTGRVDYNEESQEVELKMSKFKIFWFDIKSILLSVIKSSNIQNVRVKGKTIFLKVKL